MAVRAGGDVATSRVRDGFQIMSRRKKAREWARLRMLCCSGADAMAVAPDAGVLLHELVPNAAFALFLTTHEGEARARFHEDCPAHVDQLCVAHGALFEGPDEPTFKRLYGNLNGPKVGQLLNPPTGYFRSNTYQMLVRGCGHHHTLDARLDVDGRLFGSICLLREDGVGFSVEEARDAGRVAAYFEHALRASRPAWDESDRVVEGEAMVIANARGELLFCSPATQALLDEIPLMRTAWPDRRRLPPFCLRLIDILRDDGSHPWQLPTQTISVPGGALEVRAQWLGVPGGDTAEWTNKLAGEGLVGISLTRVSPMSLRVWRNLGATRLSPTQMEVAYWMAVGGGREAARARMSISEAVLRDCVKVVYERLGCASQTDLVAALRASTRPGNEGIS